MGTDLGRKTDSHLKHQNNSNSKHGHSLHHTESCVTDEVEIKKAFLEVPFLPFGRVTVSLPLGGLVFCFITSVIFQFDQVNLTVCNIKNIIPSISAITGVAPQRYIWRICIALHCTPRFIVGFVYYNYYLSRIHLIAKHQHGLYRFMAKLNLIMYLIENSCLVGVSYVANTENYPVHEKIFVVFMVTSLVYELCTLIMFTWAHPEPRTPTIAKSLQLKQWCFTVIMLSTAGLIYFFFRHRWLCEPYAFSFFSTFEYGIAITNIMFHYTATWEMGDYKWFVGLPHDHSTETNSNHNHYHVANHNKQD